MHTPEVLEAVDPPKPARHRLLVIDDELALGRTLAIALSDEFEVTTVTSGREALARLASGESFDVFLCDLMMPGISGMDVYDQVCATRPDLAARFILVTGGVFTERARAFVDRVSAPVVQKPFDLAVLPALLRERAAGLAAPGSQAPSSQSH